MNRRHFLQAMGAAPAAGLIGTVAPGRARGQGTTPPLARSAAATWQAWKAGYLSAEGRVIDRLQGNASHSEGQGYGALLAASFGDAEAFARIVDWTERHLAIRGDALLAWRWLPDQAVPVPDPNNAADGDLFYAWALVRGGRQFDAPDYLDRAARIAESLAAQCIRPSPAARDQVLFLPAVDGFVDGGRMIVNPSYLMPLAMRELAAATGVADLALAAQHGEALLAQLAADGLVADWVQVTAAGLTPAEGFSPNAGYEAIRVPLFLIWSGLARHPAVVNMQRVYDRTVLPGLPVPTRIEPVSGVVLETSDDPGYRAVAGLVACAGRNDLAGIGAAMPPLDPTQPYYPATLQMFAMLATEQAVQECTPI